MAGASLAEHAVPFEENFEWGKDMRPVYDLVKVFQFL